MMFLFYLLTILMTNKLLCALKCDDKYEKEGELFGIKDIKQFSTFSTFFLQTIDNGMEFLLKAT